MTTDAMSMTTDARALTRRQLSDGARSRPLPWPPAVDPAAAVARSDAAGPVRGAFSQGYRANPN